MKFCYYCGKELGDTNAFCGGCGKRVIPDDHEDSKARSSKKNAQVKDDKATSSRKKRKKPKANTEQEAQKESRPQTLYVSGDVHSTVFTMHRKLAFKTKDGKVLYSASGEVECDDGSILFPSGTANRGIYEVCDSGGSVVGEVTFSHECDEGSTNDVWFTMRKPPAPPKPPAKNVFQKIVRALETDELDYEGHTLGGGDFSLGEFLENRYIRTAGPYTIESEGKPFSFVPKRSEIFFRESNFESRRHVASIEPDGKSYRIEFKEQGFSLVAVLIYLALYAWI